MLRRTKATADASVPPRVETTLFLPLTEAQRFWTYRLLTRMDSLDLAEIFVDEQEGSVDQGTLEARKYMQQQVTTASSGQTSESCPV
jgi:SWI/SNF-related matrix-associated actin-dependent regulator of chromatin subfamily A member 5